MHKVTFIKRWLHASAYISISLIIEFISLFLFYEFLVYVMYPCHTHHTMYMHKTPEKRDFHDYIMMHLKCSVLEMSLRV